MNSLKLILQYKFQKENSRYLIQFYNCCLNSHKSNPQILQKLLAERGIVDPKQAEIFLNPNYDTDLHDPFLMRDMEKACVRLFEAFEAKEKIIIYADYDCDGIPGAVILDDLFKKIGYKNYEVYIPMMNSEGYGLNLSAIR